MQAEVIELLEKVAQEKGLSYEVVKAVFNSQFQFTREVLLKTDHYSGEYKNIRIRKFGLIYVPKRVQEAIKKKNLINKREKNGNKD